MLDLAIDFLFTDLLITTSPDHLITHYYDFATSAFMYRPALSNHLT
jgi:hypothetical protein